MNMSVLDRFGDAFEPWVDTEYEPEADHLVFVYGTMKEGFRNHARLGGAQKLFDGVTQFSDYTMRVRTTKSGLVAPVAIVSGRGRIFGECYRVFGPKLEHIDLAEGHPIVYERAILPIQTKNGDIFDAWVYLNSPFCDDHFADTAKSVVYNTEFGAWSFAE